MRVYRFPVIDGKIRATFAAELDALSFFSEDEASLRQAQFILQDENARLQNLGANYVPSALTQIILRGFDRSVTQRATCALMVLAMIGLDDIGENMSQRRAAAVVSKHSRPHHGTIFYRRTEAGIETSYKSLTQDHNKIDSLFRKHRAAAHIHAARAIMSDHMEPSSTFFGNEQTDSQFLSTVLHLQQRLAKAENFEDWNIWWIELDPRFDNSRLPEPLLPKRATISKLLEPWLAAGKPVPD